MIGLANAGGDTTNSIKQAHEFGIIEGGQKLAALLLFRRCSLPQEEESGCPLVKP